MQKAELKWSKTGCNAEITYSPAAHLRPWKTRLFLEGDCITIISQGEEVQLVKPEAEKLLSWLQSTIPHMKESSI